jgi:hypothetical protein
MLMVKFLIALLLKHWKFIEQAMESKFKLLTNKRFIVLKFQSMIQKTHNKTINDYENIIYINIILTCVTKMPRQSL